MCEAVVVHFVASQEWCLQCGKFGLGFDPFYKIVVLTGVQFVTSGGIVSDGGMVCQLLLFQNAKKIGLSWHCFDLGELVSWETQGRPDWEPHKKTHKKSPRSLR
jgi:hypothetical protein